MNTPASTALLGPLLALVALTFVVLFLVACTRVRIARRNFANLLEMPVLFYVACLALHATGKADWLFVYLAWAYVALRIGHSVVHLTYNNVIHRLAVYAASNAVLFVIWARLAWQLA